MKERDMTNTKQSPSVIKTIVKITSAALLALALATALYIVIGSDWTLSLLITTGIIAYNFLVRIGIGQLFTALFGRIKKVNYYSFWFRSHRWERGLYEFLGVKKWKGRAITAVPDQFNLRKNSPEQILKNMCQAEVVHQVCMVAAYAPMILIIWFDTAAVFFITSLASSAIDLFFVFIQRYNRPRMLRLVERVNKTEI